MGRIYDASDYVSFPRSRNARVGHELKWAKAAPHMMVDGYKYMESGRRSELAKEKLKSY